MKKMMSWCLMAVMVTGLLAGCGGSKDTNLPAPPAPTSKEEASAKEQVELVCAHIYGADTVQNKACQLFAQRLEEKTGGAYTMTVYPAAQLGNMNDILEQQKSGDIQLTIISSIALAGISPYCFDSWPFMFESQEEFERAYASEAGQKWLDKCEEESGFYLLAPTWKGQRYFFVNKDVNSLDDLKGIKIRCSGSQMEMDKYSVWGMTPVSMSSTEVFSAMQQGVVDAYEQEMPVARDESIPEVTKTVVLTKHTAANYCWPTASAWLNSMPEDFQQIYREIAAECSAYVTKEIVAQEPQALEDFKAAGCNVVEFDMMPWIELSETEYASKYPELAEYMTALKEAGKAE